MRLCVSLGQMDVALGQPDKNLARVRSMTAEARRRGSDLVLFPELWSTGYVLERAAEYAAPVGAGVFAETAQIAKEHAIHILGSLLEAFEHGFRNTAVLFSPEGQLVAQYSKVHLFRPMEEDKYLIPGREAPLFDLPWGRSALAICYDLRFPELFRKYALGGASIVFLVAEWPYPRLLHWQTLLRARAIENQSFVVACNRVGESGEWSYFGHSAIYDPSGELVAGTADEETLITAELDLGYREEVRRSMTVFEDRREAVYDRP
jgi:omega-amidase